ncbi:DNA-formamidopyrimidine glycosylase family protein [Streptomyces scopuliridis]|uniref:DNA-formamidopyrimidine glycosylase family protein n=1 Tax=Streptomyces scopuliridis TaxID=452529 RepID=UPI00369E3B0B
MPELPDVEAFRARLASCAQGRTIERVDVYDAGVLHGVSVRRFRHELEGRSFAEPERRGKWP